MMNKIIKRLSAFLMILLLIVSGTHLDLCVVNLFSFNASANNFDDEISYFPESYKPYLRNLHEKYPNWTFKTLDTGLDWSDVIEAESSKNRNLVPETASNLLKSKKSGDYNPVTDTYIEKDVGWVSANNIAVSYFMDPRNFLNETNIFQFELLSFDDAITVETVEQVLVNTFMHDKEISYFDANGDVINLEEKYSQAIYEAGKMYNINPCYLASKIRNEVVVSGGSGSGSVSGKYAGYEGYYNFYNIGSSDGNEPIKNGLKWASDSIGTYQRPWTDPKKSIFGGAEYLAEKYISKGQDTGYLQKFNVTPASGDSVYTHQYMTNVSGADSQGYITYQSYSKMNLMSIKRVFSIPVFNNMPGENVQTAVFSLADSKGQTATVNYSSINLRTTASTLGSAVKKIPFGTKVTILGKTRIASTRYDYYLNNPFWCNINVNLNGIEYAGYVSADYLTVDTATKINAGTTFSLDNNISTAEQPTYYSSDPSVVRVNSDGTLTAVKCGAAEITATTSKGGYDFIKIEVQHKYGNWTTTKSATCTANGSKTRKCSVCGSVQTETIKALGHVVVKDAAVSATYKKAGKTEGSHCSRCKAVLVAQKTVAKKTLGKVKNLKAKTIKVEKSSSITLSWSKVTGAQKYEVYIKNGSKWTKLTTTKKTSYTVKKDGKKKTLKAGSTYKFKVRAVRPDDEVKGKYSTELTVKVVPTKPTLTLKAGKKQLTASWKSISGASGYEVRYSTSSKMKSAKTVKVKKSAKKTTVKKLKKGKKYYVKVRTYKTVNGKKVYSSWSKVKNVKVK